MMPQQVAAALAPLFKRYRIYIPSARLLEDLLVVYDSGTSLSLGFRGGVFITFLDDGSARVTLGPHNMRVAPSEDHPHHRTLGGP